MDECQAVQSNEDVMNRKFAQTRPDGYFAVRSFHRAAKGKRDPRFLLKCGCCDNKLEVYYGGDSLEINGVMGSVENWRELLVPLLEMKLPGQGKRVLVDANKKPSPQRKAPRPNSRVRAAKTQRGGA